MQIHDAAGTASALHDLITHNRLAWQLACAWDKQHSDMQHSNDMPIVLACEKIQNDWKKMVWKNRLAGFVRLVEVLTVGGIIATFGSLITSGFNHFWPYIFATILLGVILYLLIGYEQRLESQLSDYCKLGEPLRDANPAIREVYDEYRELGDVSEVRTFLDMVCLEIVKMEKVDMEKSRIVLPLGSSDIVIAQNLNELRELFRRSVKNLGSFGLVTTDLKIHYANAEAKWLGMAVRNEILTDFQI